MAWSKIPNFHSSSPYLHQIVSVTSWVFPFAAEDGHCLSPLLTPEGGLVGREAIICKLCYGAATAEQCLSLCSVGAVPRLVPTGNPRAEWCCLSHSCVLTCAVFVLCCPQHSWL